MKFTNQSGGSAPRKVKGVAKAGGEDPASAQHVELGVAHKITRPVAAMAGSFSRKIPGPAKAGQDVAGEANQVKITHGRGDAGKQTWKGARSGYTTVEAPKYVAAITSREEGMAAKQSVKGKHGKGAPRESQQVAGVSGL